MMSKKGVAILSGGMDSTTMVYDLVQQGYDLHALTFNYGQRHVRELEAAKRTTAKLKLPHLILDIPIIDWTSALKHNVDVPEGHYADETMRKTVVPNRNMIMLAHAIGLCINIGGSFVAYGAHKGDHAIYPDCRQEFIDAMARVAAVCHYDPIRLWAPYASWDKNDICKRGVELGVPYGDTWTCYKGLGAPCGKCGSCVERAEAFAAAGVADPLLGENDE